MIRVAIVERPLDAGRMLAAVAGAGRGASLLFVGTVRDVNEGRAVTALDYSAYRPMAEREMAAIVREAEERWPGAVIACEHRIGELALGEASVMIAAAHPHRGEAFDSCRFVIEELKRRVPIWKREHYEDGELEWVENAGPAAGARTSASNSP